MQALEQDKYLLRRKLEKLDDEYQQEVLELQGDIHSVRKALEKQAKKNKNYERRSSETIRHLTEENQRLTLQVKQSRETEKLLVNNKLTVNNDFVVKNVNMQEHVNIMEELNKKISEIVLAKLALEKQTEDLIKEINCLTCSMEHSANKVRQMERKTSSQENTLRSYERDCEQLRSANQYLLEKLDKVSNWEDISVNKPKSLLLEIKSSGTDNTEGSGEISYDRRENNIFETEKELEDLKNEVKLLLIVLTM